MIKILILIIHLMLPPYDLPLWQMVDNTCQVDTASSLIIIMIIVSEVNMTTMISVISIISMMIVSEVNMATMISMISIISMMILIAKKVKNQTCT